MMIHTIILIKVNVTGPRNTWAGSKLIFILCLGEIGTTPFQFQCKTLGVCVRFRSPKACQDLGWNT